jgi:hypothetical protein
MSTSACVTSSPDGTKWQGAAHTGRSLFEHSSQLVIYSNIYQHRIRCVFQEGNDTAPGRGDNPALRPAFRVRRGTHRRFGSTPGYFGSRASGYPPDLVSFGRCAGAPADCVRLRWGSGVLALQARWGELSGKPRGRAGRPTGPTGPGRRERFTTGSSADARDPTSMTKSCIRSLKLGARSRASGRNRCSAFVIGRSPCPPNAMAQQSPISGRP